MPVAHFFVMCLFSKVKMRRERMFEQMYEEKPDQNIKQRMSPDSRTDSGMISTNATASM